MEKLKVIDVIYPWERNDKCNGTIEERKRILSYLDEQKYNVKVFDECKFKQEWVEIAESIIEIFLDEKNDKNWIYAGSNDYQFIQFLSSAVPISICLTGGVTVLNITQQALIQLFLSKRPMDIYDEDLAGRTLELCKTVGVLAYEDFLAPNTAVSKFMGNFNEVFSKRAELSRPTLLLDLRSSQCSADEVLHDIEQMYGRRVRCFFDAVGVLKYYSLAPKKMKMESEKVI